MGDTVFLVGVAALVWFVVGLRAGWSFVPGSAQPTRPRLPADSAPSA